MNARFALILGESEVENGVVQLKDLRAQTQNEVPRADIAARIHDLMKS